jgi:hypothetical protein
VIRAGFGIFYDRVPLSVYSFDSYPQQVITTYGPGGAVIDGPRVFANITDRAETSSFPFIHSGPNVGNFAPYSETWNVEAEHSVTQFLRLRVNYLNSNSYGVVTLTPKVVQGQDALVLGGGGKSRYRQLELTARVSMKEGQQLIFSYVHSKAKGDINEFTNYLGNFPYRWSDPTSTQIYRPICPIASSPGSASPAMEAETLSASRVPERIPVLGD